MYKTELPVVYLRILWLPGTITEKDKDSEVADTLSDMVIKKEGGAAVKT